MWRVYNCSKVVHTHTERTSTRKHIVPNEYSRSVSSAQNQQPSFIYMCLCVSARRRTINTDSVESATVKLVPYIFIIYMYEKISGAHNSVLYTHAHNIVVYTYSNGIFIQRVFPPHIRKVGVGTHHIQLDIRALYTHPYRSCAENGSIFM